VASIDLNADVGEGAGEGDDGPLLDLVTSASVACGFHAGGPSTMRRTLEAAARRGVVVGAHPSYPDRPGFGRRAMEIAPVQVAEQLLYQVGALDGLARAHGTPVRFVKPHGALYQRMATDEVVAGAVADALRAYGGLVLVAPAGSAALGVARNVGVRAVGEAFADRAYLADGSLAPRTTPGAVLTDAGQVAHRAVDLVTRGVVPSLDGGSVHLEAATICVHGDTPGAVTLARSVRAALTGAGTGLAPFVS